MIKKTAMQVFYFVWKSFSQLAKRKYSKEKFKPELEVFRRCNEKKSIFRRYYEMLMLGWHWWEYPWQYFIYELYRKDKNLSPQELKAYIPYFYVKNIYLPRSSRAFAPLCRDKSLSHAMCASLNIPQAKMLFEIYNNEFYNKSQDVLSLEKLQKKITDANCEKIFIKPNSGSLEAGIRVFNKNDQEQFIELKSGQALDLNLLNQMKVKGHFIAEEGIAQNSKLSEIYPHAVNTLRIFTEYDGTCRIHTAILRIGRNKDQIDNASAGGIFCLINLSDGKICGDARAYDLSKLSHHPDTQFKFDGFQIPFWDETIALIKTSVIKFRYFRFLGWDIAIGSTGSLVVEINSNPDLEIVQCVDGPYKNKLGIKNPKRDYFNSRFKLRDL